MWHLEVCLVQAAVSLCAPCWRHNGAVAGTKAGAGWNVSRALHTKVCLVEQLKPKLVQAKKC